MSQHHQNTNKINSNTNYWGWVLIYGMGMTKICFSYHFFFWQFHIHYIMYCDHIHNQIHYPFLSPPLETRFYCGAQALSSDPPSSASCVLRLEACLAALANFEDIAHSELSSLSSRHWLQLSLGDVCSISISNASRQISLFDGPSRCWLWWNQRVEREIKTYNRGWGCSLAVRCLPSLNKAWNLSLSITK